MNRENCPLYNQDAITPGSDAARCLEIVVKLFMNGSIELHQVKHTGTIVTENEEDNGTEGACISCDSCEYTTNVGVLPGNAMRISITTVDSETHGS